MKRMIPEVPTQGSDLRCGTPHQRSVRAVSELLWSDKSREVWFSLRENHVNGHGFGLHQFRNCFRRDLSLCAGAKECAATGSSGELAANLNSPAVLVDHAD